MGSSTQNKERMPEVSNARGSEVSTGEGAVKWHHISQEDCAFYLPRNLGAGMQGRACRPVEPVLPPLPTLQGYAPASAPKQPWELLAPDCGYVACSPLCWPRSFHLPCLGSLAETSWLTRFNGETIPFLFLFSFPKPPVKLSKGKDLYTKCNIENTMVYREEKKRYKVPPWALGYE